MQAICKREKKLANYSMLSTQKNSPQLNLFHGLADQLDQKHPLYQLANKINWSVFDNDFKKHYSEKKRSTRQTHTTDGILTHTKICSQPFRFALFSIVL